MHFVAGEHFVARPDGLDDVELGGCRIGALALVLSLYDGFRDASSLFEILKIRVGFQGLFKFRYPGTAKEWQVTIDQGSRQIPPFDFLQKIDFGVRKSFPKRSRRNSSHDGIRFDGSVDHGTGTDDRSVADGDAFEQFYISAYPDGVADFNIAAALVASEFRRLRIRNAVCPRPIDAVSIVQKGIHQIGR